MVAAAVEAADLRQREVGQLAGEEDRDLAGAQRGRGAAGADQLGAGDAEALGDPLLDLLDRGGLGSERPRGIDLGDQLGAERLAPSARRGR